jgi:hypothetical protein
VCKVTPDDYDCPYVCETGDIEDIDLSDKYLFNFRRAFIASPGFVLCSIDYSQIELRVAANMAGEETWISSFKSGVDIHTRTAQACFKTDSPSKLQRGLAKCLVKSTRVATSSGLVQLGSLVTHTTEDTFEDLNITVWSDVKTLQSKSTYYGGFKPTRKITTYNGYELEGSLQHRVKVLNSDASLSWKKFKDLEEGDTLAMCYPQVLQKEYQYLNLRDWKKKWSRDNTYTRVKFDEKWATMLGVITGDGTQTKNYISFVLNDLLDKDLVPLYHNLVQDIFGKYTFTNNGNLACWQINSRKLSIDLEKEEFFPNYSKVPEKVFMSPKPVIEGYLRGLFEADGSVEGEHAVGFCSKSESFVKDVQQLLFYLGIPSRRYSSYNKVYDRDYYKIKVLPKYFYIGFLSARKNQRLLEVQGNRSVEPIAAMEEWSGEFLKESGIASSYPQYSHLAHVRAGRNVLTKEVVRKVSEDYPLPDSLDLDVYHYEKIHALEEGYAEVVDLSISEEPKYWANGFISHNTCNFGILYGAGPYTIAVNAGIPVEEAQELYDAWLAAVPGLRSWMKDIRIKSKRNGYSETLFGRWRPLEDLYKSKERKKRSAADRYALNHVVQGSAADILKLTLIKVDKVIKERGWENDVRMLFTVHDEIDFEIRESMLAEVISVLRPIMVFSAPMWEVDLTVDVEIGSNWACVRDFSPEPYVHQIAKDDAKDDAPTLILQNKIGREEAQTICSILDKSRGTNLVNIFYEPFGGNFKAQVSNVDQVISELSSQDFIIYYK